MQQDVASTIFNVILTLCSERREAQLVAVTEQIVPDRLHSAG